MMKNDFHILTQRGWTLCASHYASSVNWLQHSQSKHEYIKWICLDNWEKSGKSQEEIATSKYSLPSFIQFLQRVVRVRWMWLQAQGPVVLAPSLVSTDAATVLYLQRLKQACLLHRKSYVTLQMQLILYWLMLCK